MKNVFDDSLWKEILNGRAEWHRAEKFMDELPPEDKQRFHQDLVAEIVVGNLLGEPVPVRKKMVADYLGRTQSHIKGSQEDKTQLQPTREKGRPKETFKDKMIDDANGSKLQKIHTKLDGKKGKDAALIILACIEKGWVMRPTYTQVKNEFGDVGSKTGYNRYLNKELFTKEELEGAKNSLD
jgi:hypothetical protein